MALWLKNLLFTVLVPGTVAVYVPLWLVGDRAVRAGATSVAGVLALALGAAIYAWCVWDFASFGRGTPAPIDAPKRLVARGLYGWSRNPMYVGVLTVILGQALLFRSFRVLAWVLAVWTLFELFVVLYEEPRLAREFGEQYARYRARVRRWLPLGPQPS